MGGKGSGGLRVGAGRKSKDKAEARLHGSRQRTVVRFPGAAAPNVPSVAPLERVDPPADLPAEQKAVWIALAPHALVARTLTPGTAQAFRDLCEAIVLKRALLERVQADGLTYEKVSVDGAGVEHVELKAHPLISQHRGMMQRVEAGFTRFRLAPMGKEIAPPDPPADPFAEFEERGSVQ